MAVTAVRAGTHDAVDVPGVGGEHTVHALAEFSDGAHPSVVKLDHLVHLCAARRSRV